MNRPMRRASILVFLAVFLAGALLDHPRRGWNVNTRLDLVFAVVDRGRLDIDAYHRRRDTWTMDKAFYQGHYYSDKLIGVSVLAMPVYAGMRLLWGVFGSRPSPSQANYVLRTVVVSGAAGLSAALLFQLLVGLGGSRRRALVATGLTVFGTLWFGYGTVFYPYVPGIAAALLALRGLLFPRAGLLSPAAWCGIGALCGLALLCDFIFGLIVLALAGLSLLRIGLEAGWLPAGWGDGFGGIPEPRYGTRQAVQRIALAALGAALPLSLFALYTWTIFGRLAIPYEYHAVEHFRTGMQAGFMGITSPRLAPLWYLTLHPLRGIFFWSPLVAAALVGCVLGLRAGGRLRLAGALGLYAFAAYLTFNASYYMWWGGYGMGPRLMLPMFVAVPLGLASCCREDAAPWSWRLFVGLGLVSLALCLPLSILNPLVPQVHSDPVYAALRVGDAIAVPQLRLLEHFYSGSFLFTPGGSFSALRALSAGAVVALPLALFAAADRCR